LTHWDQLKAVQRMQDYIEAHLTDPVTLHGLARCARYSPWYAARLFKEHTGTTPFEYIRRRRLSAAAERLREAPARIVDVAFDFVFDSHEGFTRAFARQFGVTPATFRRTRPDVDLFLPPRMREYYRDRQKGAFPMTESPKGTTVFVQVVDRPARQLILRRGQKATHYFEYCEELGCEIFKQLAAIEQALHEPLGLWLPDRFRSPGTSLYAQGVEVAEGWSGKIPEGFEILSLPACKMMVFQGEPYDDKDFEQAITSLWDVMKIYRPETYGYAWADEDGPRFQLEPLGYRGYIEGRPVRPVGQAPSPLG
jgi:AraC family transcriptional regulator